MRKNLNKKILVANSKNQTIQEATKPNYNLDGSECIDEANSINFVSDEFSSDFDTYGKKELISWECLPFSSKKNKNNKIFQKLKKKKNAKTKENKQQNLDKDKNIDNKIAKNEIFRSPKILDSITNIDNNEIQKHHQSYMTSLTNSAFGFGFDLQGGNAENQLTYIVNVQPNGDAASKGLQNGDILVSVQDKNVIGAKRIEIERLLEQYRVEQEIEIVVCRLKDPSHILNLSKKFCQHPYLKKSDNQFFDPHLNVNSKKQLRSLNDQIFSELISLQGSFLNDWRKPLRSPFSNSCLSASNSNKNELNKGYQIHNKIKNKNMNELDQNFDRTNSQACNKSESCLNNVETNNRPFLTNINFAQSNKKSQNPNDVSFALYDNISGKSNIGSAGNRLLSTTMECSEKNDLIVISLSQQNNQLYHPQLKRIFSNCSHRNMKPLNFNSVKSMSLSINDFTGSILAAERDGYSNRKQTNEHMTWKKLNSNKLNHENNKSQLLKQIKNPLFKHSRKSVSFVHSEINNDHQEFLKNQHKSNQLNTSNVMPVKNKTSMIESNINQQDSLSVSPKLNPSALAQKQKDLNFLKNDEQKINEEFEANFIEIPINIPFLNQPNLAYESSVENSRLLQNRHSHANLESTNSQVYLDKKNDQQFISADFLQIVPPIKQNFSGFISTINDSQLQLNKSNKSYQEQQVMIPKPSRRSIIPYQLSCDDPFISIKQITVQNGQSSNSNIVYNLNSLTFPSDSSGLIEQSLQSLETISDLRVEKMYKDLDETFSSITQDSFENSFSASCNPNMSAKTNTNDNTCLDEQSTSDLATKNQFKNINGLNDSNEYKTSTEKQINKDKRYDHSISILSSKIIDNDSSKKNDFAQSLYSLECISFKDRNSSTILENNENSKDIVANKRKESIENNDHVKESNDQNIYFNFRQNNKRNDNQLTEENLEEIFNQTADELKSKDRFYTRSSQDVKQLAYLHNSFNISTQIEVSLNKQLNKMLNNGSSSKLNENQIEFNVTDDLDNVLTSSSILASSINDDNEFKSGINEAIDISSIDSKSETNRMSNNLPNRITSSLTPSVVFDDGYDSTISFKQTTNESYSSIDDLEVFQSNNTVSDTKNQKIQISKENKSTLDIKDLERIKSIDEVVTDINCSKTILEEIKIKTLDQFFTKNDFKKGQKNCFLRDEPDFSNIDLKLHNCSQTQDYDFQFNEQNENDLTKNCLIVIQDLIKKIESYEKQKSQSLECISEICNQPDDAIFSESNSRLDELNDANVNDGFLSCYEQMQTGQVTDDNVNDDCSTKLTKQIIFDLNSIELFKSNPAVVNFKEQNLNFFIFKAFISNYAKEIDKYFELNNKMQRSITNCKEFFNLSILETNKLNTHLNSTQILNATEKIDYFEIKDFFKPWNKEFLDLEQAFKIFEKIFYPRIIKNALSNASIEIWPQKKDPKNNLKRKRISTNANKKVELAKFSRGVVNDDLDIFSIPPFYCVKKLQNEFNSTLSFDLHRTNQISEESGNSHSCQTKSLTKNYLWINKKSILNTKTNFGYLNRFKSGIAVINPQKNFFDSWHFNREKNELQKLNGVFAFYVEKVKILEAQNRKIEMKLDILRNNKQSNPFQIEQMFIIELDEARKVLKDITVKKKKTESWLQKSTDELRLIKLKHQEFENILNLDRQKIIFLQKQLLSFESEIFSLRRLLNNLKDEENLLKQKTILLVNEINAISNNLELEIHKSLDLEAKKHKLEEEIVIIKKEHCEELNDLKDKLITENCFNPYQLIKDDFTGALQEIRNKFYKKNSDQKNEFETCIFSRRIQLNKNLENGLTQNEITNQQNLKNIISRSKQNIIKLKAENVLLECKIKGLEDELNHEQCQNMILANKKEEEITYLKKILDRVKSDYGNELCCKNELEKEIDLFRRLLEDEDKVLKLN